MQVFKSKLIWVAVMLCVGCATPREKFTLQVRKAKPLDCQPEELLSAPGERYESLGEIVVRALMNSRSGAREQVRQTACAIGADAILAQGQNEQYMGDGAGYGAARLDQWTVTFYAKRKPE